MDMPRRSTLVPLNKVVVDMATKGHLALLNMRILFVTTREMRLRLNTYVCRIYNAKTNTPKYHTIIRCLL